LPEIKQEEVPYGLPVGWEWVRLGEIADYNGRKKISGDMIDPETWVLDLEDIEKETSRVLYRAKFLERQSKSTKSAFDKGDVLYGKLRPYLDKVVVADDAGVCTTEIVPIAPFRGISPKFLRWLLKRPAFLAYVNSLMYGVKMPRLGTDDAVMSIHQLPPFREQNRIVAKIDHLMDRCDELEKLRTKREQLRLSVHSAAIQQLLDPSLRAFASSRETSSRFRAQDFLFQHFDDLYTVKENVTELRKAILQLAVMGKLVPQDPNDPPANELLKEIAAEKQRLIKEGRIKKPKPLPEIEAGEVPYELPQGWKWVRLGDMCEFINGDRGKNYPNRDEYVPKGIPWINTGHIEPNGTLTQVDMNFITREKFDSLNSGKIELGDLVYCLRGATFGKTAIVDPYQEGAIASSLMIIRPFYPCSNRYLYRYLTSPIGRSQIFKFNNGSAQPNLSANSVRQYVCPIPPLPEQHRIVTKIDQLMTLCDTLNQQIDATTSKQSELVNSIWPRYRNLSCA